MCDTFMYYWPVQPDAKQYCYSSPNLEEYMNLISSENDVLFSDTPDNGGRLVKTPHTQFGTDRDWQISTGVRLIF